MLNRTTLDPETRVLYGDSLQPPSGYVFDAGVATTFSLDFETALAAPVSLALFAAENRDDILAHPLALLEGAEQIAGRLVVFADAGHLHAQSRPHSRLCSLLERIIVEVAAPRGGAFHPKMWALRFRPIRAEDSTLLRLLVLSRNLTRDRSWDISLRLDGEVTRRRDAKNKPLFDLLTRLPNLAVAGISDEARILTDEIAKDVRRVSMAIENCALLAIENCALSTWCRIPRFGVEVVGLGGAVGNRVGAATIKSLARQPGYP